MNYALWGMFGPATWAEWLTVAALLMLLTGRTRVARTALVAAVAVFLLISVSPLGLWLIRPLETRFSPDPLRTPPTDIVVLAGSEALRQSAEAGRPEFSDAADRVIAGATLARRFPAARLWIVGGVRKPGYPRYDSEWTRDFWLSLGIAPDRIMIVADTKDTCGNGAGVAQRAHGDRLLLVTSAFHMPRSMGCFRAAGLNPHPYPVDFRGWTARDPADAFSSALMSNVDRTDLALHEWVGLAYYRLQGRIDDIWPAPDQALGSRSQTRSE